MLKQGLKFLGLHISIIKCKFWSYGENMGPNLKKWSLQFWGFKKWRVFKQENNSITKIENITLLQCFFIDM